MDRISNETKRASSCSNADGLLDILHIFETLFGNITLTIIIMFIMFINVIIMLTIIMTHT